MDLSLTLNPEQMVQLQKNVEVFNDRLGDVGTGGASLGKDDFLKILITQLTHQDPTQPLEDKEFVAQMAQFSTLEQIMSVGEEISKVTGLINRSQALALLGRTVKIVEDGGTVTGAVTEVTGGDSPRILVNGNYYDLTHVETVRQED
jgi:flagellar basal-body rod modification protein FlgD